MKQKPFKPFTLELVNGGRIEVNHPEALERHDNGLIVYMSTSRSRSVFEVGSVVRFFTVTGTT